MHNNNNSNNDNTMANKPELGYYRGQSQRRQRRERSAWKALTWLAQRCTPVYHGEDHGENHSEDHGEDHGDKHGDNHGKDHGDNGDNGEDHGEDHQTVIRCVKEAEAHAEDGDKDKKHGEGAGLLIKLSTAEISKFPKLCFGLKY